MSYQKSYYRLTATGQPAQWTVASMLSSSAGALHAPKPEEHSEDASVTIPSRA